MLTMLCRCAAECAFAAHHRACFPPPNPWDHLYLRNIEKENADRILKDNGLSASRVGLRFDRVVVGLLGGLRSYAEKAAPDGMTVLVTISAPIHLPAKTADVLKREIETLISSGTNSASHAAAVNGNSVRLRICRNGSDRIPKLIGFVHNSGSDPALLLDMAERWLRSGTEL